MISRYSRKELVQIWSEENKYKIWLDVEIAAAEGMEKIATWIDRVIVSRGDSSVQEEVKKEISSFCSDFPLPH